MKIEHLATLLQLWFEEEEYVEYLPTNEYQRKAFYYDLAKFLATRFNIEVKSHILKQIVKAMKEVEEDDP